jgi:large subunit ribosomal protein L17
MRHGKHRYSLGRTKEHREALMANLASALFKHGKIETTLAKAKALRPFAEKIITMAKKAHLSSDAAQKLHYRRLAISRVKDEEAVAILFNERAVEFAKRNGGYARIYKLVQRVGDAAKMAIIELISAADVGYSKSKKRRASKSRNVQASRAAAKSGATGDGVQSAAVPAASSNEFENSAAASKVSKTKKTAAPAEGTALENKR